MNKKKLMLFSLVGLFTVALASAAILSYYGVLTWDIDVGQAVVLTGSPIFSSSLVAGESFTDCGIGGDGFNVKNNANVGIPIQLGTDCWKDEDKDDGTRYHTSIDWADVTNDKCDGITTEIYGILELTTKDVVFGDKEWTETETAKATVKYTIVGSTFSAEVISSNGITLNDYSLIYYKDNSNRFSSPAKAILVGAVSGSLPYNDDGNLDEYEYCTEEEKYNHCHGAKIWLVPKTDIDSGGSLTWANANDKWLFETDLIVYSNDTTNNEITLPANGGGFDFCVKNDFALNLVGDTYTIKTSILPVTV